MWERVCKFKKILSTDCDIEIAMCKLGNWKRVWEWNCKSKFYSYKRLKSQCANYITAKDCDIEIASV